MTPRTRHAAYNARAAADVSRVTDRRTDRQTPRTSVRLVSISCIRCSPMMLRLVASAVSLHASVFRLFAVFLRINNKRPPNPSTLVQYSVSAPPGVFSPNRISIRSAVLQGSGALQIDRNVTLRDQSFVAVVRFSSVCHAASPCKHG